MDLGRWSLIDTDDVFKERQQEKAGKRVLSVAGTGS